MTDPSGQLEVVINTGSLPDIHADLLVKAVLGAVQDAGRGARTGEISVTLLADDEVRAMNRDYLEKDHTTDVIAFSLGDGDAIMGDVYIGYEQALRQAADLGVDEAEELARLAIHGTLHVLGHDHPEGDERAESPMFELQERILREVLP